MKTFHWLALLTAVVTVRGQTVSPGPQAARETTLSPTNANSPAATPFLVDLAARRQVMDNFGANDAWTMENLGTWSEAGKNRIADLLFSTEKGIGLSCWRFYLGAGLNHQTIREPWSTAESFETAPGQYDWSRLAGERWFLRAAKARGVAQFTATVYSPPLRLTRNGLSNLAGDAVSTTNLKPGAEDDFAGYLTDILQHFRDNPDPEERIEFNCILPVNEPEWEWAKGQEGNRASNDDLKRIFTALHRRLEAAGLKTKISGPEAGSLEDMCGYNPKAKKQWQADYGDYISFFCGDPRMHDCLGGLLTYHSYWSDQFPDQLAPRRERLGRAMAAHPDWKLWQSEYCVMQGGRDLGMDTALQVARLIHCDLTLANASAWQWWLAVSRGDYKDGLIYTDYHHAGDAETLFESKILWALGNYSRFIRPGMERVEVRGQQDLESLMVSAFCDAKSGRTVIVLVNMAATPHRAQITLKPGAMSAAAAPRYTPYITSEQQNLSPGPPVSLDSGTVIPARSVVTLVGGS